MQVLSVDLNSVVVNLGAALAGLTAVVLVSALKRQADHAESRYQIDLVRVYEAARGDDAGLSDEGQTELTSPDTEPRTVPGTSPSRMKVGESRITPARHLEDDQEKRIAGLPIQYHAQVLGQAQTSFLFSIGAAVIGFLILAIAIALVLGGRVAPGLATMVASVIAEVVPALFFTQSNRARKLVAGQLDGFRADAEIGRQARERRELIELVRDPDSRDKLIAETVLKLAAPSPNALPSTPKE